jgi:RNA polymerase sigma-70 factor (ECF subfamily)
MDAGDSSHAEPSSTGHGAVEPDGSLHAERALVRRLREGDPEAFAMLIARYTNQLARFAFYIVGSRDGADDIVQQVWTHLWEQRAMLDPERFKPYLFRAVRNRALDEQSATYVRERYRTNVLAEATAGTLANAVPSPEETVLTKAVVQAAIEQLPERRRLAIRLRFEEEMSHAEIADVLGVSSVAAQRLVSRAMADLREIILGV